MTKQQKESELLYCIQTLWREYIISSKEFERLKKKIEKEVKNE